MVLKKINNQFDDSLRHIFSLREANRQYWTNARCQEEFNRLTGENWSFRTMQRRYDQIRAAFSNNSIELRPYHINGSAQPDH